MAELGYLEDGDQLNVTEAVLQLYVKHKAGSSHAYMVRFDVADDLDINQQLNNDLQVLTKLMTCRAANGVLEINGRKYYAIEVNSPDSPALSLLSDNMPILVLPTPQVKDTLEPIKKESVVETPAATDNMVVMFEEPKATEEPVPETDTQQTRKRGRRSNG